MAQRHNHYDAAFESYLRGTRVPYVAVDEKRRALLQQVSLKSMDFIVYSQAGRNLLIDVKGRRFPSGAESSPHKWENWTTADDIDSLLRWEQVFGGGFRALLVFAYHILEPRYQSEFEAVYNFADRPYAFYGVWVDDYQAAMRRRSASWETVSLPSGVFRELRLPIHEFL